MDAGDVLALILLTVLLIFVGWNSAQDDRLDEIDDIKAVLCLRGVACLSDSGGQP